MDYQRVMQLEKEFSSEKKFIKNGYYRIRDIADNQKSIAFLIPDACGATSVHPEITIEKINERWLPTKLIDMTTSPTQIFYLDNNNSSFLEEQLDKLVTQFEKAGK